MKVLQHRCDVLIPRRSMYKSGGGVVRLPRLPNSLFHALLTCVSSTGAPQIFTSVLVAKLCQLRFSNSQRTFTRYEMVIV